MYHNGSLGELSRVLLTISNSYSTPNFQSNLESKIPLHHVVKRMERWEGPETEETWFLSLRKTQNQWSSNGTSLRKCWMWSRKGRVMGLGVVRKGLIKER